MAATHSLDGRSAIVTGASAGIGEATAHALAREGARVAIATRRRERLEGLADELEMEYDAEALVAPTDVREADDVDAKQGPSMASEIDVYRRDKFEFF